MGSRVLGCVLVSAAWACAASSPGSDVTGDADREPDGDVGVCAEHCSNGERDCREANIDCGGPDCRGCDLGQRCSGSGDCASGLCLARMCQCADPALVMVASTGIERDERLDVAIRGYQAALAETEGICAVYLEVDAPDAKTVYGARVDDVTDWLNVRRVIAAVAGATGARTYLLLGGPLVMPRPEILVTTMDGVLVWVPSDSWYFDFDDDRMVDAGYSVGRMPDLGYGSSVAAMALDTAAELHARSGFLFDNSVFFGLGGYETPPFGVCYTCDRDAFLDVMQTNDDIEFYGHGDPTAVVTDSQVTVIDAYSLLDMDLSASGPVVSAFVPCSAGQLQPQSPTLAYGFMRSGVAAYVARTTGRGTATPLGQHLRAALRDGMQIGHALSNAIRESTDPSGVALNHQVNLYGDPTLRRRPTSP